MNIRSDVPLDENIDRPSKRVLITTAYIRNKGDYYDWVATNVPWKMRLGGARTTSLSLRFLKENVPGIEILEYPTWDEYTEALKKGWDVVGISFYLNETHRVKSMVDEARKQGVKTLWGGNYGILTPETQEWFDEPFIGYSENNLRKKLGLQEAPLKHPEIIREVHLPILGTKRAAGLFTTRGCTVGCSFCQGPCFTKKLEDVPAESVRDVLDRYMEKGVNTIAILDENFGANPRRSKEIVSLLEERGIHWACMTRADFLEKRLDDWTGKDSHFFATSLGIESFNQDILDHINKKTDAERVMKLLAMLKERKVGVVGYYLIGFPQETRETIKIDIRKLASMKVDINQITVLTPLPGTPLWDEIEQNYGITEKDYERYDTKHLVWNHPHIGKEEMDELLQWSLKTANSRFRTLSTVARIGKRFLRAERELKRKKKMMKETRRVPPNGFIPPTDGS